MKHTLILVLLTVIAGMTSREIVQQPLRQRHVGQHQSATSRTPDSLWFRTPIREYSSAGHEVTTPKYDDAQLHRSLHYPYKALIDGIEGRVVIAALIGPEGKAINTRVESSSNPIFVDAALDAILRYQFAPLYSEGRPDTAWLTIPLTFTLPNR